MHEFKEAEPFCTAIALHLGLGENHISLDSSLVGDLLLDSIQIFELVLLIETWLDRELPIDDPEIRLETVRDIYKLYVAVSGREEAATMHNRAEPHPIIDGLEI